MSLEGPSAETPPIVGSEEKSKKEADNAVSRRGFLKGGGALLGALAAGQVIKPIEVLAAGDNQSQDYESLVEKRKRNFALLNEIIVKEKIKEKLIYLKENFGEAHRGFLDISNIEEDIEYIELLTKEAPEKGNNAFASRDGTMVAGSVVSEAYEKRWQRPGQEFITKLSEKTPTVSGFENTAISNDDIKTIIEQEKHFYPVGWLTRAISSIDYRRVTTERRQQTEARYGITGATIIAGVESREGVGRLLKKDPRAPLEINHVPDGPRRDAFRRVMAFIDHESAHANDWANSLIFSSQERINLLYDVANRYLGGGNRYKSDYVENITHPDSETANYQKINEYWAELCREFFQNPAGLARIHPEDFLLVRKWIKNIDPSYNPAWGREWRERAVLEKQ